MKKKNVLFVLLVLVLVSLSISACFSSETAVVNVEEQQAEVEQAAETWPEDLPLPEEAYDIDITGDSSSMAYKVPGNIETVLAYLQTELEELGWAEEITPDSSVGAMATIFRRNENGDTLAFNLQYNQLGEFVTVNATVLRND